MRAVMDACRRIQNMPDDELVTEAKNLGAPLELVRR
jgi:pyridoxal 5'-phosphate synthase pdxS subunit